MPSRPARRRAQRRRGHRRQRHADARDRRRSGADEPRPRSIRSASWSPRNARARLILAKLGLLGRVPACTDLTTKPWVQEAGVEVLNQPFYAERQRRHRRRLPRLALPGRLDHRAHRGHRRRRVAAALRRTGRRKGNLRCQCAEGDRPVPAALTSVRAAIRPDASSRASSRSRRNSRRPRGGRRPTSRSDRRKATRRVP